jgi:hypothetical protein
MAPGTTVVQWIGRLLLNISSSEIRNPEGDRSWMR